MVPTLITSLSTRWFSLTGAQLFDKMLRQRKLARLCAFIACERTWTDPPTLALDFIQLSLSGPVCCSETAAEVCPVPSEETITNCVSYYPPPLTAIVLN